MDLGRLRRSEWIAMVGGLLLAVALFLPAYTVDESNENSRLLGAREAASAWDVHGLMRYLLLAAALAPFILAWIIVRDHQLSWGRGELTAVVAIAAAGLIFYNGVIDRPDGVGIGLTTGWFLMMLGAVVMMVGAVQRSTEAERRRKPPGVL